MKEDAIRRHANSIRGLADSRPAFRAALAVSVAVVIAPILATRYLPFVDAPEHAAVMATLRHWSDPAFAAPYQAELLHSPYLAYHLAGALLTWLVGDAGLANRLLLALAGACFPLSFTALLRASRRDERLAIFACLPFWSRPLVLGFLPFVASIPLAFWALAMFVRLERTRVERGTTWRRAGLALLATVLFYAHISTWTITALAASVIAIGARRPRSLLPFAPSVCALVIWLVLGRLTLGSGSLADSGEIDRIGIGSSLVAMPRWIFDVWQGHADEVASIAWWLAFLVAAVVSARAMTRYSRRAVVRLHVPFLCALAIYIVMPFRVGAGIMLNLRIAPMLVLLLLLPARLPRRSVAAAAVLALALVANVTGGVAALVECSRASEELGERDLDDVLDALPRGARLMTLNFETRPHITHVFPWAHVGGYHRVRHGGVSGFSFSELHHWPLQYTTSARPPPKPGTTWDFDPCTFRNATDGPYYDFVLVRGHVDPFAGRPPGPVFDRVLATGPMTLYGKAATADMWPERSGSTPHAEPDAGPCARKPR